MIPLLPSIPARTSVHPVLGVSSCRCTIEMVTEAWADFGVLYLHW